MLSDPHFSQVNDPGDRGYSAADGSVLRFAGLHLQTGGRAKVPRCARVFRRERNLDASVD